MKRALKAIWWGMVLGLTLLCFVVMKIFEDAFFFWPDNRIDRTVPILLSRQRSCFHTAVYVSMCLEKRFEDVEDVGDVRALPVDFVA